MITSKYDAANPAALRRLVANGAILKPFSRAILDASWKAANEVYIETGAANPRFKRIHDSMLAFRAESYLWWQVSDYAYDTYQLQMRGRT